MLLELLELHGPDGQTAWVAPAQITSLRAPTAADLGRHFTPGIRCIVTLTDSKFVAVAETCEAIRAMLAR